MTEEEKLIRAIRRTQKFLERASGPAMGMSLSNKLRIKAARRELEGMVLGVRKLTFELADAKRAIDRAKEER